MPRGTRALFEVAGCDATADWRQHSARLHVQLLPAACWCDREFVLIHRSDLLDGNTGSCGRKECGPPDGSRPAPSVCVSNRGSGTWNVKLTDHRANFDKRYVDRTGVDDNLVLLSRRGRFIPRPRTYPPEVRVRRDFVVSLYSQGKHPIDIALALDVPVSVIRDDLIELRSQRRVA